MTRSTRFDCELRITLPATIPAIEEFFLEFQRRSQALLQARNCFAAELLVREALTNAVMHGSLADPGKSVRCTLRLRGNSLFISVADDGDGFDWRAGSTTASTDCSGRGLEILRLYADRVRFSGKGNVVTMIKRFDEGKHS